MIIAYRGLFFIEGLRIEMTASYVFSALHCLAASLKGYTLYRESEDDVPICIGVNGTREQIPGLLFQTVDEDLKKNNRFLMAQLVATGNDITEQINKVRPVHHKEYTDQIFIVTAIVTDENEFLIYKDKFPDAEKINTDILDDDTFKDLSKKELQDIDDPDVEDLGKGQIYRDQITAIDYWGKHSDALVSEIQERYKQKQMLIHSESDAIQAAKKHRDRFDDLIDEHRKDDVGSFYKISRVRQINDYILKPAFSDQNPKPLTEEEKEKIRYLKSISVRGAQHLKFKPV